MDKVAKEVFIVLGGMASNLIERGNQKETIEVLSAIERIASKLNEPNLIEQENLIILKSIAKEIIELIRRNASKSALFDIVAECDRIIMELSE